MTNLITIIAKFALTLTWSFIQTNLDSEILMAINQTIEISGLDMIIEMLNGMDYAEMLVNAENGSLVIMMLFVSLSPMFFFIIITILVRKNESDEMSTEEKLIVTTETKVYSDNSSSSITSFHLNQINLNIGNREYSKNLR